MAIRFEWNPAKAQANRQSHRVTFEQAVKAFADKFAVEWIDDSVDYGEERLNLLGMSDGVLLHVTYTERDERIRIISARRANRHEQQDYYRENSR
jgi:uncharacterized DUF497 family protein